MKNRSVGAAVVAMLVALAGFVQPQLEAATNRMFYDDFFPRTPVGDAQARNPIDGTEGPKAMAAADLNGDGCMDLIVGNLDGSLSVLLGQTNGILRDQILVHATNLLSNSSLRGIVVADFNGDGHLDVAAGDIAGGGVVLLRGDGTGNLQPYARIPFGPVRALATADINRDGKMDLVAACGPPDCEWCNVTDTNNVVTNRIVSVLMGNGDGTFQNPTNLWNGTSLTCFYDVAVADLDLDGWPEILVLDNLTGVNNEKVVVWQKRILIFSSGGTGRFIPDQPQVTLNISGQGPRSFCLANMDERLGNGAPPPTNPAPDIVVANRDSSTLEVFLNQGGLNFSAPVSFSAGDTPRDVAAADLDGDGYQDLVVVNRNIHTITVLRNTGSLQIVPIAREYPTGVSPRQVVLADYDGDGIVDAAVNNRVSGDVSVFIGSPGLAGFLVPDGYYPSGFTPVSVVAGDFNGDGLPDLVTANVRSHDVRVRLNQGAGSFGVETVYPVNAEPAFLATGDLNNDGHLDLVVSCLGSTWGDSESSRGAILVMLGKGNGSFYPPLATPTGSFLSRPFWLRLGDLSRDGVLDLAVGGANGRLVVFKGKGNGTFESGIPIGLYGDGRPLGLALGDFDEDGRLDIACSRGKVFLNDGQFFAGTNAMLYSTNTWTGRVKTFNSGTQAWAVEAEDLDQDGHLDLIVALTFVRPDPIGVLFGNGNGTFTAPDIYEGPDIGAVALAGVDMDGDGIEDIVVGNRCAASILILRGLGNRKFALQEVVHTPAVEGVVVADLNQDGRPDLAAVGIGLWRLLNGIPPHRVLPLSGQQPGLPDRSGLFINEIMAANDTFHVVNGATPDWVEIYNHSPSPQSLSGWALGSVPQDSLPNLWYFPGSAVIPAYGHKVVYCKKKFSAGAELVAPFELSAAGETLVLFKPGLIEVDRVAFPAIPVDTSYARFLDGARFFGYQPAPSLGQPNMRPGNMRPIIERKQPFVGAGASTLALNAQVFDDIAVAYAAVCYRPAGASNAAFTEVPLNDDGAHGDKQAGDGYFGATLTNLPSGSMIEFYFRTADLEGQADNAPSNPDDPASLYRLTIPSASQAIRITELVADNQTGLQDEAWHYDDWIELLNTASNRVNLAGLALTLDSVDQSLAWPLPTDVWLEPGQRQIIFCDESPWAGIFHATFKLSRLGDRVYLVRLADWVILDSLCYDALPTDTSFGVIGTGTQAQLLAWPTPNAENLPIPTPHSAVPGATEMFGRFRPAGPGDPRVFSLRWQATETNVFHMEWSDNLKTWTAAPAALHLGLGLYEWNDPTPPTTRRYYRAVRDQ